jgi:hypothetical protein
MTTKTLLAIAALSFGFSAWAQRGPEPSAAAQRVTVMDLEGDLIEGTSDRPDVEPVTAAPRARHESLIRVRQDFRARVLQSASAL